MAGETEVQVKSSGDLRERGLARRLAEHLICPGPALMMGGGGGSSHLVVPITAPTSTPSSFPTLREPCPHSLSQYWNSGLCFPSIRSPEEPGRGAELEAEGKGSHSGNFLFKAQQETNDSAVHRDPLGLEI